MFEKEMEQAKTDFYDALEEEENPWEQDENEQFTNHMKAFGYKGESI